MAAPTPVIVSTPKVDKKLEFMKGIKRSTSDYVEFTDSKKWYDWKKKTMITAASHGVADVLIQNIDQLIEIYLRSSQYLCLQFLS